MLSGLMYHLSDCYSNLERLRMMMCNSEFLTYLKWYFRGVITWYSVILNQLFFFFFGTMPSGVKIYGFLFLNHTNALIWFVIMTVFSVRMSPFRTLAHQLCVINPESRGMPSIPWSSFYPFLVLVQCLPEFSWDVEPIFQADCSLAVVFYRSYYNWWAGFMVPMMHGLTTVKAAFPL